MGTGKIEVKNKLGERKVVLREAKERVETFLKERKYTKTIEEIEAFSQRYIPGERDLEWAELQVRLAFARQKLGKYDKETAKEAYEVLKLTDRHKEIGTIEGVLGRIYLALGETKTAFRHLRNSLSVFDRIGDKDGKIEALNILGQACFLNSRTKEAIEHLTEALNLCREGESKSKEAMVLGNLGTCYVFTGEWASASKMLKSSLNLYGELNTPLEISRGLIALARLLTVQREFAEAEELLQRAVTLSQGYPRELAMSYESLGDLTVERGQLQKAKEYYERTLEIGRRVAPQGDLINQVQRRRAELLIMEGKDLEEVSKCCAEALKVSQTLGDRLEEGCCYRTMGRLFQAKGDPKTAQVNFEKAVRVLRSIEERFQLANTLMSMGGFSRRLDPLREAHSLFAKIQGAEFYEALTRLQLTKVEPSLKSAVEHLQEAEAIFQAKGEEDGLKEVETLKAELNRKLSSSQAYKYQVLQGLSSEDLGKIFERLIKEVEADRGFVAYGRGGRERREIEVSHNLTEEETERLLSLLADGNGFEAGRPSILYDTALDDRFSSLAAGSVMVTLFGNKDRIDGFLYVDRQDNEEPFLDKEFDLFYFFSERIGKAISERRQEELERANQGLRQRLIVQGMAPQEIITQNKKMLEILREVDKIKDYRTSVLIQGESGTGKELIAQRIHFTSLRNNKRLISIDCGAIPDELFESEVFGYEKGAFTGATGGRKGLIEEADGGTLFLDEVGNLSLSHQAKLLRVLENGKVRRLGGNRERRVDLRVITATNKDLMEEVKKGKFREDLFYRIKGIVIALPPLRERRDDIRLLAQYFLDIHSRQCKKGLGDINEKALEFLEGYQWPGNVRGLKNEMERIVIIADEGKEITPEILTREVKASYDGKGVSGKLRGKGELTKEALERSGWNKTRAAQSLGITRQGLIKRIKRFGLERAKA